MSQTWNDAQNGTPRSVDHESTSRPAIQSTRARLVAWFKHIPFIAPQTKRNALTLQALLGVTCVIASLLTVFSFITNDIGVAAGKWHILLITIGAAGCFFVLRSGQFRLAAGLTVLGGLALIGLSYQAYGLRAQTALQFAQLLPLLLAGLLLGRGAMWATALANAAALVVGAKIDMGLAGNPAAKAEVLPALLLAGMNLLVLVAVLDRLILSTRRAIKRSEELDATCLALEREVAEKEQAYARLLQTQRMEAIGRLSTGIAHDFHNILSVIFGLATSPLLPSDSPAPILAKIRKAADHGTALTRRLLSFGRTQSKELATFDLVEAIEEMKPLIEPMFFGDSNVALELPASGILVRMDREELELVLLNIASNARDAMPNGGRFTLRVEPEPGRARIELEDTGIGMTPDVLAKVFEPFFTTKPKDKGTGIGMAVVHRFVKDCGGSITIESTPQAGTRIAIRIPVVSAAQSA